MTPLGTLLTWNGGDGPAALFWHETARAARVARIEELGEACRIAMDGPAGVRMTTLLPPDVSFMQHGNTPHRLAEAVTRVVGGARPLRVLAVESVDSPALFAAARAAFDPDIVGARETVIDTCRLTGATLRPIASLGMAISCDAALAPIVEAWCSAFDERARCRHGVTGRYRIDDLLAAGVTRPEPETPLPLARVAPGRRVCLVLPGHGGGRTRLGLHLLAGGAARRDGSVQVLVDGVDARIDVDTRQDWLTALLPDLAPCLSHRLEICNGDATADLALVGVEVGPAP